MIKAIWRLAMEKAGDHFGVIGPHGVDGVSEIELLVSGSKPMGFIHALHSVPEDAKRKLELAVAEGKLVHQRVDFGDRQNLHDKRVIYCRPDVLDKADRYKLLAESFYKDVPSQQNLDNLNGALRDASQYDPKITSSVTSSYDYRQKIVHKLGKLSPIFARFAAPKLLVKNELEAFIAQDLLNGRVSMADISPTDMPTRMLEKLEAEVAAGRLQKIEYGITRARVFDVYARFDQADKMPDLIEALGRYDKPQSVQDLVELDLQKRGMETSEGKLLGYTPRDIAYFQGSDGRPQWQRQILGQFQGQFRAARQDKMKRMGINYDPNA